MKATHDYILVFDQDPRDIQGIETLLKVLKCPTVVTNSPDQVVARVNENFPYLMILVGNHQSWPKALLDELRNVADSIGGTILSLTNDSMPSWTHQEENPGFDGFLVQPLNSEILVSLVQSAWVKQRCSLKSCPLPRSPHPTCVGVGYGKQ